VILTYEKNGIAFNVRNGTSDLKTFEEVIGRDVYQKKGMKILPGEHWYDCGGNVGAFTLLACRGGRRLLYLNQTHTTAK